MFSIIEAKFINVPIAMKKNELIIILYGEMACSNPFALGNEATIDLLKMHLLREISVGNKKSMRILRTLLML
ncbi:MAG: hypothetical protein KatS3mg002_0677 [Candidatus Woesearchaeota archaeon]|nr:MAG: hypothetical protein KatS3mg002_0677 [Candidatus Woesearchaeota archaeon]